MTMTKEQIIQRIIDQEIYVNASTFVRDLLETDADYFDDLAPCLIADDWREPVTEAIQDGTAATLADLITEFGFLIDDVDPDELDTSDPVEPLETVGLAHCRSAILNQIDGNEWQDVAEHMDIDPYTEEALQHWLVSDWLADKLEAVGGLVARDVMGFEVWGRTECGQSLTMDGTLSAVADLIMSKTEEA